MSLCATTQQAKYERPYVAAHKFYSIMQYTLPCRALTLVTHLHNKPHCCPKIAGKNTRSQLGDGTQTNRFSVVLQQPAVSACSAGKTVVCGYESYAQWRCHCQ